MNITKGLLLVSGVSLLVACGKPEKETVVEYVDVPSSSSLCSQALGDRCRELENSIVGLTEDLNQAVNRGDKDEVSRLQLEMNRQLEILRSYREGKSDISEIEQRYAALKSILDKSINKPNQIPHIAYKQDELNAVREVFETYGDLYIKVPEASGEPDRQENDSVKIDGELPWSGYWYPKRSKELFEGVDSPLRKLDRYLANQGIQSQTADWEARYFDQYAAAWEGHCDAWAIASVLTKEPRKQLITEDETFSISDLKALAIMYFEGYQPKVFGRRYQGVAATDGQIQDIRPEAFHRMMKVIIGEKRQPLLIDEDPGAEVWVKPIIRVSWRVKQDPEYDHAVLIKAFPWMIKERGRVDDRLTDTSFDLAAPAYEYRLFYDVNTKSEDGFKVIAGEWINSSENNHPDMIFVPGESSNKLQTNKQISSNHEYIRKLLAKAGML